MTTSTPATFKNTMRKITKRETLTIVESFTNGFAQNVLKLSDGRILFIGYDQKEIEICETVEIQSVNELDDINEEE